MNEKDLLREVTRTVTDKPVEITVRIKPKNRLHAWLMKQGHVPEKKKYTLSRLLVGNRYRISEALLEVPTAAVLMGGQTTMKDMLQLIVNQSEMLIYIAAVGLTNRKEAPSESLLNEIRWQFNDTELMAVVQMIVQMSHPGDFMNTIILARGLDIVSQAPEQAKMGPTVPGTPSEA